ncbi:hypothetical protein FJZ36_12990 [Candidatus Poribacteria bacterium]|nr:hypothetical protein [Candidatus Poribacteria bacterium]
MPKLFLGIDIGTTATKVGVFGSDGKRLALASAGCPVRREHPGWAEQDPEDWWRSFLACWEDVRADGIAPGDINAVGVSGHFSTVFLDAEGKPARPAITWQDARAVDEAEYLTQKYDETATQSLAGARVPFAPSMPACKVRWVMTRQPEVAARVRWIAQTKDYIALQLCGEVCSDVQSMLGLVHVGTGVADPDYAADLGIRPSHIPRIAPPFRNAGYVTHEAYEATGLRIGVPVSLGWVDAFCSMLATGVYRPGAAFDYAGTSEIVGVRVTTEPRRHDGLLALPFDRKSSVVYGLTNCGADALAWAKETLGLSSFDELLGLASTVETDASNPMFIPYLDGERSPIWDADATGSWINLRRNHGRNHLAHAALEGVAYGVSQLVTLAGLYGSVCPSELVVSGGGARSDLWSQIRADVTGLPVQVVDEVETGALGAAMLAAVAYGEYESMADAAEAMTRTGKRFQPDMNAHRLHRARQQRYDMAYDAMRVLKVSVYEPDRE